MLQSLRTRILLLLIVIMLFTSSIPIFFAQREIYDALVEAEKAGAKTALFLVTLHLQEANKTLVFQKNHELEEKMQMLKNITSLLVTRIDTFYNYVQAGKMTETEAKRLVADEISRFRYGNNDYALIVDSNYIGISHPDEQYRNVNLYDLKDIKGNYILRPMVSKALKNGNAYTSYWFHRLGNTKDIKKISYSVYYPKWKWVVATGVYIDDIDRVYQRNLEVVLEGLRETFNQVSIGKTGYLFMFNGNKRMLIHKNIDSADNFAQMKNPDSGNFIADELIKASSNPDQSFVYLWNHPDDQENFTYWKEAYMSYFKPLDWYVGYSVYMDELEAPARSMGKKLIILFVIYLVLALVISIFFSNTMIRPIKELALSMRTIKDKGFVEIALPPSSMSEINELADIFTQMVESIKAVHEKLEIANEKRIDSIQYAHLIQNSVLPDLSTIQAFLPNSFIVWLPRDIVSGDFYQFYPMPGGYYIIIGDCTGHGVPGGFMTMLVVSVLRRIIFAEKIYDPGAILTRLNVIVKNSLKQTLSDSPSNDGLDGAILYVKPYDNLIQFAGARTSLFMIHKDTGSMEIQGNRKSVGYSETKLDYIFNTQHIVIEPGTHYYLSTDGLVDQIGEKTNLPFGKRRLFTFLEKNYTAPFGSQKVQLTELINEFQGNQDRLDDITIFGFRI